MLTGLSCDMCMCEYGVADDVICEGTPAMAAMAELAATEVAMAEDEGEVDEPAEDGLATVARIKDECDGRE